MPGLDIRPAAVRTRSPRQLAGSRLNKHYVLVGTQASDRLVQNWRATFGPHADAAAAAGDHDSARLLRLLASEDHDAAQGSKPDHPFRAVNIDACFGPRLPLRDSAKAAAARRAGDCGRFAAPMTALARAARYERQRGVLWVAALTPAQRRRIGKKARSVGEQL